MIDLTHLPPNPAPVDRTSDPPQRRYPTRNRVPSSKLLDYWTLVSEIIDEPLDFQTASLHPDWKDAINREIGSILKNNTWEVVDRPPHRKPITAKWLFRIKKDAQGKTTKLKARVVARGFQQQEGVDFNEIFAPVVKWSTILIIFVLASQNNWPLHQLDIITAFLNGTIHEDIIMEIPAKFPSSGDESKVCKINRALYGLKQSPKAWYDKITNWL